MKTNKLVLVILLTAIFCFCSGVIFRILTEPSSISAAVVTPMREKTGVMMTKQADGRWSIPGGLPIARGSEKIYRNGLRQYSSIDYKLSAINPHFVEVIGYFNGDLFVSNWSDDDIVVMDYLY